MLRTVRKIAEAAAKRAPKSPLLGLDMGSDSVKIVQLAGSNGKIDIKNIVSESRPDSEKEITENEAIKRIVNRTGIRTGNTITTLPSREINEKFITLHRSAVERMDEILKWEVKKHINFPIEDAVYDYFMDDDEGSDQLSVHLAISKRELIENKVRSLKDAGFSPAVIETESRAIQRIVTANEELEGTLSGVINLGSSSSTFIILKDGKLKFCRDMDVTGEDIDRTISKLLQIDIAQSEIAKKQIGLDKTVMNGEESEPTSVKYNVYSGIEAHIDRLISEINQSMHFYSIQSEAEGRLDRLYITGGNAQIPNLVPFMKDKLETDVKLFDPVDYYGESAGSEDQMPDSMAQFAVAIGLAMRGV